MKNIKLEMEPPYRSEDKADYAQKVVMSIEFNDAHAALKFLGDLQKLVMSYTPEAE